MSISISAARVLLALAFPVALMSGPAAATEPDGSPLQLRTTEITESSHPFETLYCAREPIRVRFFGDLAEVVVDNESRTLIRAVSASGARYVAPGDDTTEFWTKGALANVTWSGQELPLCAPAGAAIPPYRASGNEPFWAVTYDGWSATLKRPGEPDVSHDVLISDTSAPGQTLVAGEGTDSFRLETRDGLCVDSMSGMPRPQKVTLHYQAETLNGCGGNPERLLQGVTWRISHIGEQPTGGGTEPHIRFLANNNVAGSTGCNRFFGEYTLTGEGLRFKDMGSTRMACSSELMAQEGALLKALEGVNRFSFETSDLGRLRLHADGMDVWVEGG